MNLILVISLYMLTFRWYV